VKEWRKKIRKYMNFDCFDLDSRILNNLRSIGYSTPTPIQEQAIPSILQGRDVIGLAQTGTGKTAAFALPIVQRLTQGPRNRIRALIVAPTRELTEQTQKAIQQLARNTHIRSTTIYGGVGINAQIQALRRGVEIVSCCPGRLLDHVQRGSIDLSQVEVLVLDEADRMFDMGFLADIRKIVALLPRSRQTLLFSATMPAAIRSLVEDILRNPSTIQAGKSAPVESVAHTFYPVAAQSKAALLKQILEQTSTGPVIVFTRTKHRSKTLARQLEHSGYRAAALNGNLTQAKRQQALDGFHQGRYEILVATDIAARGIDVSKVSHVINYDMPDTVDAYTHRIGRTGRAQQTGEAFTFVCAEDGFLELAIKKMLGTKLKYCVIKEFCGAGEAPRRANPPTPLAEKWRHGPQQHQSAGRRH